MGVKRGQQAEQWSSMKRKGSWEHLLDLEVLVSGWSTALTSGVRRRMDDRRRRREAAAQAGHAARDELRSVQMAAGSAVFTVLVFLAAAYPFILPHLYLLFAFMALPCRVYHFAVASPRNFFFLLDFCYAVNLAVAAFLLAPPAMQDPRVEAALYSLADGPVASALLAWQCPWLFSSAEHTISVLVHLLPGLAMYAHHHLPRLTSWAQLAACVPQLRHAATALRFPSCIADAAAHAAAPLDRPALWLLAAPAAFYAGWQLAYWLVVQVACERFIRRRKLDTSYLCLARRAKRADNVLARVVLRGSTARRLLLFGALQLAFTAATLLLFIPTYYSWHAAFLWQVVKFGFPVWFGTRYLCQRLIKAAISEGIRRRQAEDQTAAAAAAAVVGGEVTQRAPRATRRQSASNVHTRLS